MNKLLSSISLALVVMLSATSVASAAPRNNAKPTGGSTNYVTGVDISWPNCSNTIPSVSFGIVGVTNGTGYSTNPCLAGEAALFSNLSLYVNTGWNSSSTYINATSPNVCAAGDNNCLAYNYGYNAGIYAVNAANNAGVHSSAWWLDVETGNTWNADTTQNRNSLQGEYDALVANGATTVGVYSTTSQWDSLTGTWLNNWPSWGATSWTTASQAHTYCIGHQFTGGPSLYMQYLPKGSKVDYDVQC